MGGTRSRQKGSAKGANKSTDAKLHNAVHKTLCVLSQQVREVRGAVSMCWMIKKEAPEYKKPKEQLRAYSELAATKGKGHGLGPPGIAAFTGLLQALSERQHSGSGKRGWSGKPQANVGRHGTGGGFRFGTSLQAGQSVRPCSEPSRTRHQRGTTPRTRSWGTRTNRSESSSRSSSKRSFGTGTVSSDGTELKKSEFCCSITSPTHQSDPDCDRMTGDKVLRQIRNSWIVQLENWWEQEAMQSPVLLGGSRAGHWTRSSVLRKMQHVKCILRSTSDGWQACLHGLRSRHRAVTD